MSQKDEAALMWILLGGLLIFLLWNSASGAAQQRPGMTAPLFPQPNDILTVLIQRPGAENPAYSLSQQVTDEITRAIAQRGGYIVFPIVNMSGQSSGAGTFLRTFQVQPSQQSEQQTMVELPRQLAPGLTVVNLQRPFQPQQQQSGAPQARTAGYFYG